MKIVELNFLEFLENLKTEISDILPGFNAQKSMSPSIREDLIGNANPNSNTRQSAVLILLFIEENQICTIFIKRPVYEGPHSGQVSFPGGKYDETDLTIQQTALRETQEEIGVNSNEINLIGALTPLYIPISNLMVNPFVGFISTTPILHPNLQEVAYTVTVPLDDLLNPQNKSIKVISSHNRPISAPYYNVSNEMIWGATAMILAEFLEIVKKFKQKD